MTCNETMVVGMHNVGLSLFCASLQFPLFNRKNEKFGDLHSHYDSKVLYSTKNERCQTFEMCFENVRACVCPRRARAFLS
jgi:hypothetical protein